eukprot:Selendium_serpulae@DN5917_c6_g1_i3.p2
MTTHDQLLMGLISQHQDVESLLDTLFSFLRRRTDFFVVRPPVETQSTGAKVPGFLQGDAESIVVNAFRKHQKLAEQHPLPLDPGLSDESAKPESTPTRRTPIPAVSTAPIARTSANTTQQTSNDAPGRLTTWNGGVVDPQQGVSHLGHRWTQSICDITVEVALPTAMKAKELSVEIKKKTVTVKKRDGSGGDSEGRLWGGGLQGEIDLEASVWELEDSRFLLLTTWNGGVVDPQQGVSHLGHRWTQSICDITVEVALPTAMKAKELSVEIKKKTVTVKKRDGSGGDSEGRLWGGGLQGEIDLEASVWELEDSRFLLLTLFKREENWWKSTLV